MTISCFFGVKPGDIGNDPQPYVESYKSNGAVAFKEIKAEESDVAQICAALSPHLGWTHTTQDQQTMAWPYLQDHDKRINVVTSEGRNEADATLIEWHLDGASMKYPQYGGAWNMFNFKAPEGTGSTGFVDMCQLYADLDDGEQDFFDRAEIIHLCNWSVPPSPEMSEQFIADVRSGSKVIYSKDGDGYVASHSRPAVSPHPATKKPTLRACPCHNMYGLQEHLLLFDGQPATDLHRHTFAELMDKVRWEICENEERQEWYFWDEGDLMIADLFRMAHGVRAGYSAGQRTFQGYWLHEFGVPEVPSPRLTDIPKQEVTTG